jgi:hypothetical protein
VVKRWFYGGVLDRILFTGVARNVQAAAAQCTSLILPVLEQLIVSKTPVGSYVNRQYAALAKRMRDRDPGSAPSVNDRVRQYMYIVTPNPKALQGERVEEIQTTSKKKQASNRLLILHHQPDQRTDQLFSPVAHELPASGTQPGSPETILPTVAKKVTRETETKS